MELGYTNDQIHAGPYGVSTRTLQRMRQNWKLYGTVYIPCEDFGGRPRALSELHEQELLGYLDKRPMAYLDEMMYFLLDEFGLRVVEVTIWNALHRLGWSRKIGRKVARERNHELRDGWYVKLSGWRAEQLIFLDESAACERTGESF